MKFIKGHTPWSKGRHFSEEHKEKIRLANLGKKKPSVAIAVSQRCKNKPISQSHKEHIRAAVLLGYRINTRRRGSTKGPIHGNWRGGISRINKTARQLDMQTPRYREWRSHVFQRDNYTCQACGQVGGTLQADHELPYSRYPDLRYEILNGRTLCKPCHLNTPTYGKLATTSL